MEEVKGVDQVRLLRLATYHLLDIKSLKALSDPTDKEEPIAGFAHLGPYPGWCIICP